MRALAVAAAAAAIVLGGAGGAAAGGGLHGLVPQPLPHKPSFTLTDTAGRPFRFADATGGKLTYLYFGYTHCPDACPTTMADLARALHEQSPAVRRHVEVVFVTVDPRRDTRRVLRAWLNHFDRSFVGLTGSRAAIDAAEHSAGIPATPPEKVKGSNYSVAHSSLLFPFSPDGFAHVVYVQGFHTADYAHDMPLLLRY
jgi:protein SCO1